MVCLNIIKHVFPHGYWKEFKKIFYLAWCTIATSLSQFFLQTTSIIMCGHLSKYDLDSAALANTLINVFGICIGMGLTTACDTLFSQAFGSNNQKIIGVYLQKGILINLLFLIGLYALHINIEPILLIFGQEPIIAKQVGVYLRLFMPGLLCEFLFILLARYLQNQNILLPSLIIAIIGNIINALSQYVCIYIFDLGYRASAICQAASYGVMLITEFLYIIITQKHKSTWDGWSKKCLFDWSHYVKLAVPGLFMIALEDWSFEICTIVAGTMGTVQLGAQSIIFQLEYISFMLPLGMSIAVNIRIGHLLGAGKPMAASNCYRVALTMIWLSATVMAIVFITAKDYLPKIFSNDDAVLTKASNVLPILCAFQYFDGTAAVSCGALRGCGRQLLGSGLLFLGYYVLALPLGISLALFTNLDIAGLWIGLLVGVGVEAVVFLIVVSRTNWTEFAFAIDDVASEQGMLQNCTENRNLSLEIQPTMSNEMNEKDSMEANDVVKFSEKPCLERKNSKISNRCSSNAINPNHRVSMELNFTPEQWRRQLVEKIGLYGAVLLILFGAIILHLNWILPEIRSLNSTDAFSNNKQ